MHISTQDLSLEYSKGGEKPPDKPWIPVRFIILALGIYSSGMVYGQRNAINVAIVAMLSNNHHDDENPSQNHHCAVKTANSSNFTSRSSISTFEKSNAPTFDWDEQMQGIILGAHFWLYTISPAIIGRLGDRFGGKWITIIGNVGGLILSLISPIAVEKFGVTGLIVVRVLMGGFHGCIFSPLFTLYVRWFPPHQRAVAVASMCCGGVGATIMSTIAGWLSGTPTGWPLVFYVNAGLYVPLLVLWTYYVSDWPSESRVISRYELEYLDKHLSSIATIPKVS